MLPKIWIFDTYSILLFIGVILCLFLFYKYGKKNNLEEKYLLDIILQACISIIFGIISATLFQKIFDNLKSESTNSPLAMTFFGGLIGGAILFILLFKFYIKRRYPNAKFIKDVLIIAPASITMAHGIGRIGCFLAGCCYGIETNSILGVQFPHLDTKVYPTQLYEAMFLIIFSLILFYLAYKKSNIYTFPIYLFTYGIFRFLLEFIRGDDRGAYILNLSPSQFLSIISVIISIILFICLKKQSAKN